MFKERLLRDNDRKSYKVSEKSTDFLLLTVVLVFSGALTGYQDAEWPGIMEGAQLLLASHSDSVPSLYAATQHPQIFQWLSALVLRAGISPAALAVGLGVFGGIITFVSIGYLSLAFVRNPVIAMLCPFIVCHVYGPSMHAPAYPIHLLGTYHTLGSFGLLFSLFALALWTTKFRRLAALIIGSVPLVHLIQGAWLILVAIATNIFYASKQARLTPYASLYFVTGLLCSIVFYVFIYATSSVSQATTDEELIRKIFLHVVKFLDGHRSEYIVTNGLTPLVLVALIVLLIKDSRYFPSRSNHHNLAQIFFIVAATAGSIAGLFNFVPPEIVPQFILQIMPGRFINLAIVMALIFLISSVANKNTPLILRVTILGILLFMSRGALFHFFFILPIPLVVDVNHLFWDLTGYWLPVAGYATETYVFIGVIYAFVIGCLLSLLGQLSGVRRWFGLAILFVGIGSVFWSIWKNDDFRLATLFILLLIKIFSLGFVKIVWQVLERGRDHRQGLFGFLRLNGQLERLSGAGGLCGKNSSSLWLVSLIVMSTVIYGAESPSIVYWKNNEFFARVHKDSGFLFVNSSYGEWAKARRMPVIVPGVDTVPYSPATGPRLRSVLNDIYGIDLLQIVRSRGKEAFGPHVFAKFWRARSTAEWIQLGKKYHATGVMCIGKRELCELDLPLAARAELNKRLHSYYLIP